MAEFRLSNFTSGTALTAAELNTGLTYADYTPTWTQSATITKTVNWARYTQFGKFVVGSLKMTASSAGTSNNIVKVGLPVTASSNNFFIGTMIYFDSGTAYRFSPLAAMIDSSTTMCFSVSRVDSVSSTGSDNDKRFGETFLADGASRSSVAVASGDIIYVQFQYEAA